MALKANVAPSTRWRDWVILMLREADGCQPSLGDLAALTNISPRTLTRHLAISRESFRHLAKTNRHQCVCTMLAGSDTAISQIAYRLGYSDAANFSQAFQALAKCSPRAYRLQRAP